MRINRLPSVLLIALLLAPTLGAQTRVATLAPLPTATPESAGFAPGALNKMDEGMQGLIANKSLAGIETLVARHGKVVQHKAYGMQTADAPMKLDTIARIYSMTKPIAGVAMMMLYEEGKWKPSDPIAKHIPEFANLKVYAGEKDGQPVLEAPAHAPTMGELMSHSAGFTYGLFGNTPVDQAYRKNNPLEAPSLQAMIDRLATMPLLYQPGTKWVYSVSVDIQGYLVEKLSGKPFPEFLRTRLFEPLGMIDTGFFVPAEKLSRVSDIYSWDRTKESLVAEPRDPLISKMPGLPSGGGGLYSTASDYFRFAQMLLNGGEYNGKRILKKATVDMMHTNVLSNEVLNGNNGIGQARFSPAQGFGYDFAIVLDPDAAKRQVGKGSYWWWGIAGTWFWIDPTNDVIFVGIIQRRTGPPGSATSHEDISRRVISEALLK
ncbi:MAG TPA: serine hydrolase domain-containing protein [Vicinamibacterales bacterium]|nr:serine hydrolase domain-containing protein [Vicinamibacterales bacterium]